MRKYVENIPPNIMDTATAGTIELLPKVLKNINQDIA